MNDAQWTELLYELGQGCGVTVGYSADLVAWVIIPVHSGDVMAVGDDPDEVGRAFLAENRPDIMPHTARRT